MNGLDHELLSEALADFGYTCEDNDLFFDRLNRISIQYNLTGDDLVDELIASAMNLKRKSIDCALIDLMEPELAKRLKKNLDAALTLSTNKYRRPVLSERAPLNYSLTDVSCMEVDTYMTEDIGSTQLTGMYAMFAPFRSTPSNGKFQSRTDRGSVLLAIKGELFVPGPSDSRLQLIEVEIVTEKVDSKYANDKIANVIEAKYALLRDWEILFQTANPDVNQWSFPTNTTCETVFIYGEVLSDMNENLPMGDTTISLLLNNENISIIRLDLSHLPEISLFPGQIVAFEGKSDDDSFVVSRQLVAEQMKLSPLKKTEMSENLKVWCAAGPFTSSDNVAYEPLCDLLSNVKREQPHVLILMGPFVDRRNVFMHGAEFDTTYEALMSQLMRNISIALEGCRTELIIQPATSRDACCINVFPTAPFKISPDVVKILGKRLHLVSDPCIVKVCGVEIALTSSEVIVHLGKTEWHRSAEQENTDRITRLSSHLLSQRSLYPLSPTSVPSSLEALHRLCRLRSAPHMIIAPSIMAGFIKTINGCVVANPGPLSRGGSGSFLHCDISVSVLQDAELFSECGSFQVVKI